MRPKRPANDLDSELAALYRSHFHKLVKFFRYALRHLDPDAAEDLVHETFIRAHLHLPEFRREAQLSTWVHAIARNVLLEHRRKLANARVDFNDDAVAAAAETLTSAPAAHLSASTDCVNDALEQFTATEPERADTILMALVMQYTREELAEHLGRTVKAATQYLHECKKKFKPYLERCCKDRDEV